MMVSNKSFAALVLGCFALSACAQPTNWTPYVSDLKNSCDTQVLSDLHYDYLQTGALPAALKKSVVSIRPLGDGDAQHGLSIQLKNASAFGHPISSIQFSYPETEATYTAITFYDNAFFEQLPQFYIKSASGRTAQAGTKKMWREQGIWSQQKNTYQLTHYQALPYQIITWDDFINTLDENSKAEYDDLYLSTKNGWFNYNEIMPMQLLFDDKKHQIICTSLDYDKYLQENAMLK